MVSKESSAHLGSHTAERAEHGPAGMDDLQLTVLGETLGISRQTDSVLQDHSVLLQALQLMVVLGAKRSELY